MICTLQIVRYPRWFGWAGFLSMAVFRFPLWFNRHIRFWKLMGSGRNGTFDKTPDWRQWAVLFTSNEEYTTPAPLLAWWRFFNCSTWTLVLEPIEGHGTWDGQHCFGILPRQTDYEGKIAILTRATIRPSKLKRFWQHVDPVAQRMHEAPGFITSIGIGEMPWIRQATFSIWESKAHMKQFAYQVMDHAEVVRKTRQENWYSEDMFVRFRILRSEGALAEKPAPARPMH